MSPQRIIRPATAFSVAPASGKKRPRIHRDDHLKFIRGLPCCVTGLRVNVEAAHIRIGNSIYGKRETGIGEKPSDHWVVPLNAEKHREQHSGGELAFWNKHNIDPFSLALALFAATGDDDMAETILRLMREKAKR